MVAVGAGDFKRLEAEKAARKTFVTNLNLRPKHSNRYDGYEQRLCSRCAGIFPNSEDDEWQLDLGTLKEINEFADDGCVLCVLLREVISSISSTHSGLLDKFLLSIDWRGSRMTIEQCPSGYSRRTHVISPIVHAELDIFVDEGDGHVFDSGRHWLILSQTGDPASSIIQGRPDIEDFTGSKSLDIIQHWMHECARSTYHSSCQKNLFPVVPLRLIDIGKEGDTQIKLSQNHKAVDYVALSYCWGGGQDVVLTAEDAQQALFAFEFWTLPATIQDAIIIVRKLGMRYLWIDALCIIQKGDDGKDFAVQAPKMDGIYGSAFVTIAVASTSNVEGGIFRTCKSHEGRASVVKLPYELASKQSGSITISARNRTAEFEAEPLLSRCWTLQERVLSQRVLSFHKDHLTWNCRNGHHSSDGIFWPKFDLSYLLPSIIPPEFFTSIKKPSTKIPKFWRLCVEDYSNRFRTVESDKLTAIAGVARRIHKQTGDVYLAGLWKSDIMMQLCWSTVDGENKHFSRPSCYLSPSWSWASLDSQVKFFDANDYKSHWRTCLVNARTSLLNRSNIFSEVTDGCLVLQGPLKQARNTDEYGSMIPQSFPDKNVHQSARFGNIVSGQKHLSSIMDGGCEVDEKHFCKFYWLWMYWANSVAFLLLLEATGEEAVFRRVGSIELKLGGLEFDWFRDAEVQNVKII